MRLLYIVWHRGAGNKFKKCVIRYPGKAWYKDADHYFTDRGDALVEAIGE